MWLFFDCISAAINRINDENVYIIAGALSGFVVQLIIVAVLEARLSRHDRE